MECFDKMRSVGDAAVAIAWTNVPPHRRHGRKYPHHDPGPSQLLPIIRPSHFRRFVTSTTTFRANEVLAIAVRDVEISKGVHTLHSDGSVGAHTTRWSSNDTPIRRPSTQK